MKNKTVKMRHILLFFLAGLISIDSQAQRIASSILLQDGTTTDSSHVFVDGEMPTFHFEGHQCENVFWSFSLFDQDGEKMICKESEKGTDAFTFKIERSLFSGLGGFQTIKYPNDSSVYIRCSVDLHHNDVIIDSVHLLLNVLPSRPKIKKATISGHFDFEAGGYEPSAELTVLCSAERMTGLMMMSYVADSFYVFQFPKDYTGVIEPVDADEKGENLYEIKYGNADWGQFYTLIARNEYGHIWGDTLFTTSIIDDPEILHFIETEHNKSTAIDDIQDDDLRVSFKDNILVIEDSSSRQIQSEVYSVNGMLINRNFSAKSIDLNYLCSGAYIVKVKSGRKTITKKVIKK